MAAVSGRVARAMAENDDRDEKDETAGDAADGRVEEGPEAKAEAEEKPKPKKAKRAGNKSVRARPVPQAQQGSSLGKSMLLFAVIIGGLGSLWGTLAGGMILGVAQSVGLKADPGWGILAGHLAFLAVLAVRPNGLFARTRDR